MEKKSDPLSTIEELITQLEKLNLTPLPASQQVKKDVSICIKKIVFNFDIILSNKLRLDLTQNQNPISKKDTNHYWNYISKYYQIPSVRFCNLYDKVRRPSERGMLWILLSITEKSFYESVNEIYIQNFDKKFYDKSSLIATKKDQILNLCNKLNTIHLIEIKTDLNDEYFQYKQGIQQNKNEEQNEDDLDFLSPIMKQPNDKNVFVSNLNIEPIEKKKTNNLNSMFFSRATIDLNNPYEEEGRKMGMESIFMAIDNDEKENETPLIDINNNDIEEISTTKSINKKNFDEKQANFFSKFQTEKENYIITKISDLQNCLKEEFYTFKQKNVRKQNTNFIKDKKKDNIPNQNEENIKTKYDLILNPNKKMYYPIDKYFKITRKSDKNLYSKKDIVLFHEKEIKLTNSILFYLNNYYKKEPFIKFKTKNSSKKPITINEQNYQCFFCKKKFNTFMGMPTENIYWCSYYLRFICKDCVSEDYSIIPDFLLKKWSFKKFSISKKAKELLEKWYDKPVIYFKQTDPIIKRTEVLHSALILKRKIHKIFDLMKCDNKDEFVKEVLGEYQYLLLHENLFSLRDLVEINDLSFFDKLTVFEKKMEDHILKDCQTCLYKGGRCIMCMSKEIIYAFDIENVIYCNDCKKMFHKKCCTVHPCIINR